MLSEITPAQLHVRLAAGEELALIDVREPEEYEICRLPESTLIPLGDLPSRAAEIAKTAPTVIICHHGYRSAQAIQFLMQRHGYTNLLNLKGGIHAWAQQVDPQMPVY